MRLLQALGFLRFPVVVAVVALFALLHVRRARSFGWTLGCWFGIYALVRFGFTTPIPSSVVMLYMGITSLTLAAYVSSSAARRQRYLQVILAVVELIFDLEDR